MAERQWFAPERTAGKSPCRSLRSAATMSTQFRQFAPCPTYPLAAQENEALFRGAIRAASLISEWAHSHIWKGQ
jgi:hypothetical protein